MFADDEVDYDQYTPPSPDLDRREQGTAPPPVRPKYLDHLWVLEGQPQPDGCVHTRCQASNTGCELAFDELPGFTAVRNGTLDPSKFHNLLAQLPTRLRGGSKEDFVAGVAFAVTLWETCNPVIINMAEWALLKHDQHRFGVMRPFVPVSPCRDETTFEYVAIWANRLLARMAFDSTSFPHNYAKFQERVVNFARERRGLKEPPPNFSSRGDTRGRTGPSAARQSARRQRAPRSRSRSTLPEAKRPRREAEQSPARSRCVMEDDLSLLRDEVAELCRRYDHSEQEFEGRLQGLQEELHVERSKRRDLQARFLEVKKLSEESAATADSLKSWASATDHQRDDFYKKCSELERLVERLSEERDRVNAHLQALHSKIQLDYSPFEELKE
ncbi:unnamed protein product [Aphanomyces euteiches]